MAARAVLQGRQLVDHLGYGGAVKPPADTIGAQLEVGSAGLDQEVVGVPGMLDLACTVDVGLFERGNQDAQAGIVESCHYGVVTEIELG